MNILPLTQRLEDQGVGAQGKTIFAYMMPAAATSAVMVRNELAGTRINHQLPGYFKTRIQVIARGPNYQAAEKLMKQAVDALTLPAGTVLDTMTFNFCRPETLPVAFPLSTGNLIEFNAYFEVCFVEES
jgi:hypothetical protein